MKRVLNGQRIDVVVVGAGVAGLSAATAAAWSGRSVVVIEKSATIGGTARLANGSIWIPNNDLAIDLGILHDEAAEVRFILSQCWPSFDATLPWCGVDKNVYLRAERYVREGTRVIRDLTSERVQSFTQLRSIFRAMFYSPRDSIDAARKALEAKQSPVNHDLMRAACSSWDYHWANPHNIVPYGKHLWASIDVRGSSRFFAQGLRRHAWHILKNLGSVRSTPSLVDQIPKLVAKFWGFGHGLVLVERFRRHLVRRGVPVLTGHELVNFRTVERRVVSVDVRSTDGGVSTWEVTGGVILATGCFSQRLCHEGICSEFPIQSSCVTSTNEGDALRLLESLDVQTNPQPKPLLAQNVFPLVVHDKAASHEPVFFLYGDSFFVLDRFGRRVMNEKLNYHDRAVHHAGCPERRFLFLICDRRFKERNWGFGISLPFDQRFLIRACTAESLAKQIQHTFESHGSDFRLADGFAENLAKTREAFDAYAEAGIDTEFGRGANAFDVLGFPKADRDNRCPLRKLAAQVPTA